MTITEIDGPYFDDIRVGERFDRSPSVTLTAGLAAAHQAIVGNRIATTVDHTLGAAMSGVAAPLVSPALTWDISIGQSTPATHAVVANLYYRNLAFHRAPHLGDTLTTVSTVLGLRRNQPRAGRHPTGLVLLNIRTVDQLDRTVLDYRRCAMVAARQTIDREATAAWPEVPENMPDTEHFDHWDLTPVRAQFGSTTLNAGDELRVVGGDVVSSAPELARLTHNVARIHHDATVSGRRLVYGGHSIGIALHHLVRALPGLVTVTSWRSCDHTAPVHEGDTLHSRILVEDVVRTDDRTWANLRVTVRATRDGRESDVLNWALTALLP